VAIGEGVTSALEIVNLFWLWPQLPWSLAPAILFVAWFWRVLGGDWPATLPEEARATRRARRRTNSVAGEHWPPLIGAISSMVVVWLALGEGRGFLALSSEWRGELVVLSLAAFNVGFAHPLVEEVAFRGYMQLPLEERYKEWMAVGTVAILFGVLHSFRGDVVAYLILGVALGCITATTNSIWPALVLHVSINVLGLFPAWGEPIRLLAQAARVALAVTGCVLFGFFIWLARRQGARRASSVV
jgi:membrane protease YdiL (CAAX protease family)